ncbi:hypothetical protein FH972_026881 [Carpinus fangiana]|uniref:Dolichyl-diphosphooligosaccharide--protein glycosyltransferase 48 kDa subunit n=1 Tax=Carpinus fangiana TaxID=176857 RepID=A0A5N6L5P7_9ROSI|nr:hypothetical protein FH972_026881 [Carpinus fangiana]
MKAPSFLSVLVLLLVGVAHALSSSGSRLLVVTDDPTQKGKYSKFWADLEGRGFSITFESPKSDPALTQHGELNYDHLLILPTKLKALGPALTPQLILDFMKKEGNVLLALSSGTTTPTTLTSLLLELDIHLPLERDGLVVDHFNFDAQSAADKHDVLLLPRPGPLRQGAKNYFGGDGLLAVPRAIGQTLGNASPLLAPILPAPPTAYSYNPSEESEALEDPFATGKQLSLATAFQSRNSARFSVLGSAEMLEDAWFGATVKLGDAGKTKTANQEFAKALTGWTFKELGVLKVGHLQHFLRKGSDSLSANGTEVADSELNPKIYRIKNEATYTIELSEYSVDHWIPFVPATSDSVQLEFSMLSPYHRLSLAPVRSTSNSTIYATSFILPDQHGIFNFRVNYKRPFLNNVDEKNTVTVRHFAHDEWPRSFAISGAWVWIVGIWATVVGWLGFCGLWLWSAPRDEKRIVKKRN